MDIKYFHFSLGPVQSFIAEARRTRDFWAGSFILSWLSAVAMKSVMAQEAKIIFPKADDNFLSWLEGKGINDKPEQGAVPNRFKASVNKDFKPEMVIDSVNKAWLALADKIYQGDLKNTTGKSKEIWDRQVAAFWEINWVVVDDLNDSSALNRRKNWRSYLSPEEAGVKCMMMEGWQELSGDFKPEAFWKALRDKAGSGIKTDLRPKESLCAIGFIKRRFPRYFNEHLTVDMPNGWKLKGWEVKPGRPSVAYMAAVHWLEHILKESTKNSDIKTQLWKFHDAAYDLMGKDYNEWDNQITCIKECKAPHQWKALDGNVFFETALENQNIYDDQDQAKLVLKELKALQRLLPNQKSPTPFYAVLMMDGDSLGVQMSDASKQAIITEGLGEFTKSVLGLVLKHNGFLIYAGGDDVLAVLPLEDALPCALAIRKEYVAIFARSNHKVTTSISAAIEFAPIKMPLMKVLKDAHDLLDEIAKEKTGRDALAVRVWKPGGMILEWAMSWDKAIDENGLILVGLAEKFAEDDQDGQLSNKFLYKIKERFDLLNPTKDTESVLSQEQGIQLMAAEYVSSGLSQKITLNRAYEVVKPLMEQCHSIYRRLNEKGEVVFEQSERVSDNAALLMRFLAQKGVNR